MATCYNCGCSLPPGTAVRTRVLKGHEGRKKSGYVLMCAACSKTTHESNLVVAVIVFVVMAVTAVIFALVKAKH